MAADEKVQGLLKPRRVKTVDLVLNVEHRAKTTTATRTGLQANPVPLLNSDEREEVAVADVSPLQPLLLVRVKSFITSVLHILRVFVDVFNIFSLQDGGQLFECWVCEDLVHGKAVSSGATVRNQAKTPDRVATHGEEVRLRPERGDVDLQHRRPDRGEFFLRGRHRRRAIALGIFIVR